MLVSQPCGICVFRTLLAREHKRIRAEYEERVKQLEQERQGVEEERVQVCLVHLFTTSTLCYPYKSLLLYYW